MLPLISDVQALTQERLRLTLSVRAPQTLFGYANDWKRFRQWADIAGRETLPASAETVAFYLTELLSSQRKITTAERHLSSIKHYHREAGYTIAEPQKLTAILTGARRLRCEHPTQKKPISVEQLRAVVAAFNGETYPMVRNRAMLLVGFATALRRSNIVALSMGDIDFVPEGLVIHVRKEKQDQKGKGRVIGVPTGKNKETCPVEALRSWLANRGMQSGPLFTDVRFKRISMRPLHPNYVGKVVKKAMAAIGLDPSNYAGHSLRAGFVTEALECGATEAIVMAQTGHRSSKTLQRYFRPTNPFRANACAAIGL